MTQAMITSATANTATEPWRYILSAGRTGTVFLENLLSIYAPDVIAEHEPHPTRYQMMLGNMRNDLGLLKGTTRSWVHASRKSRDSQTPGPYIEINPFLCAVSDLLPDPDRPLRIVHIVREPVSWASSMTVFKASTKYRGIIDFIPFAKPFPAPRPAGWQALSQFEKNLHRWVWCNQRILDLADHAESFVSIRYEDLFSDQDQKRITAVGKVFDGLGLASPATIDWELFDTRVNPAPKSEISFNQEATLEITAPLATRLGYHD